MPESFEIKSSDSLYRVNIGRGLLRDRITYPACDICVVDANIAHLLPEREDLKIISIVATEQNKSLECMPDIFARMRELGVTRSSRLVAVGGGVIQDIATLLASLYMRGIAWEYLPSTLLGMVDSCIGGKSSINVGKFKNMVGNIYPPDEINIDIDLLDTLGDGQIIDGLCEAVKICYASSFADFEKYLECSASIEESKANIEQIIALCLKAKKWFIEIDEFDHKERLLLNYGHTFGHALESALDFKLSHGIAVGIGMVVAVEFARSHSLLTADGLSHAAMLVEYIKSLTKEVEQIPDLLQRVNGDKLVACFENDKKHRPDSYRVIVPMGDGSLSLHALERNAASLDFVGDAFRQAFKAFVD